MSKSVADIKEAKKLDTVSLTQILRGIGGESCPLVDVDDDGNKTIKGLDVRTAILLALKNGSRVASSKDNLTEAEQVRCWTLGNAIANTENTGYSFKAEDIVLIKKMARLVFPGVEPYTPQVSQ